MPPVVYPPKEIIDPPHYEQKNIELILLWMLNNNGECLWSDFTREPLNLSTSTISKYFNRFKDKGFLKKLSRGHYSITPKGRGRFNELSTVYSEEQTLNYPPEIIKRRRVYDHWILWMLYNNNFCRWSDFLESPLSINQSSLSKNLNRLQDNNLIIKENKEYRITQSGKIEYSKMLRGYNLDRQSILDEESKRIDEITNKTLKFFKDFKITEEDVQFRYLNNILKLDYERVKPVLTEPTDFEKIILFLSINHPDQFPKYISITEFSKLFNINKNKLAYYVDEIVENQMFPVKFFKLQIDSDKSYFFQENGKLESILRAITENYISKNTYITRLHSKSVDIKKIEDGILDEIRNVIFNKSLIHALRGFLPDYINYLAYKFEEKLELRYSYDKLDAVIWHNMLDLYSTRSPEDLRYQFIGQNEVNYQLNIQLLEILRPYYKDNLDSLNKVILHLIDNHEYTNALNIVNSELESSKGNEILISVQAILLCYLNRFNDVLELIGQDGDLIKDKEPTTLNLILFFITSFSNMTMGNFEVAIELSNKSVNLYPNHPLSYAMKGIALGYSLILRPKSNKVQAATGLNELDRAIGLDTVKLNKGYYYQLKSQIYMHLNKFSKAIDAIDKAINFNSRKLEFYLSKGAIFLYFNKYDDLLLLIETMLPLFPEQENDLKMRKASIYKQIGKLNEGFQIVKDLHNKHPEDIFILNLLAYWYLYMNKKDDAINTIEKAIKIEPEQSLFYDSYGEILMYYQDYEKAIEQFNYAIQKSTFGWLIYQTYIKLAICYKEMKDFRLAKKYFELGIEYTEKCFCDFETKRKWLVIADLFLKEIEGFE